MLENNSDHKTEKQEENQKDIPISQLRSGMYVLSVSSGTKQINIKNKGYILHSSKIDSLKKAGIKRVIIDPSKNKEPLAPLDKKNQAARINSRYGQNNSEEPESVKTVKVSLDTEMKTAQKLYNRAKKLQHKVVDCITKDRAIDTESIKINTDAMVESIFRNPDALCCLSQLRDKDQYLIEHALNVSILMAIFAKHLNIEQEKVQELTLAAFLHDIGKIKVQETIINKPGKLTVAEFEEVQKHVDWGVEILTESANLSSDGLRMVKEHHERQNGGGYPAQLKAEDISLYGRMIAIIDSYDAMTSERKYQKAIHPIKAFKLLLNDSPSAYDGKLVEQLIQCLGLYPVGTLVKLNGGKLGLISKLNPKTPLQPFVRVFYNTRLNQTIAIEEIDLSKPKYNDQIDCCIKPKEFGLNLIKFFKAAFID